MSNIPSAGTGNAVSCAEHAIYLMMAVLRSHNEMADRWVCSPASVGSMPALLRGGGAGRICGKGGKGGYRGPQVCSLPLNASHPCAAFGTASWACRWARRCLARQC